MLLVASVILVTACAGSIPGESLQGFQGCNRGIVTMPDGVSIEITGCKDNATVALEGDMKAGTFTYAATDSTGAEQAKLRAALEQAISADVREAFPEIFESIIDAVIGVL